MLAFTFFTISKFYNKTSRPARRCPREKKKKKSIMKPTLHFLYVPVDLKVYYQHIPVHKKRGRGVAFVGNG